MSTNRAVAASQRRREISGNNSQPVGKPGPISSIGSAQVLSQRREQQGQPSGRLAGQHATYSQQQQQKMQQQQQQQQQKTTGNPKITIAQAITLISLRLGKLENSVMQLEINDPIHPESSDGINTPANNDETIDAIQEQLSDLENSVKTGDGIMKITIGKINALIKQNAQQNAEQIKNLKSEITKMSQCIKVHEELINTMTSSFTDELVEDCSNDNIDDSEDVSEHKGDEAEKDSKEIEIDEELLVEFSVASI